MKRFIIIIPTVLLLMSCNKDYPEVLTVRIASETWTDPEPVNGEWRRRFYVKWGSDMDWSPGMGVNDIEKFTYQEGNEYLIKVELWEYDYITENGTNVEYKFKKLLSRESKKSEGLPDFGSAP